MKTKKSYVWLMLAFICIVTATAAFLYHASTGNTAQVNRPEAAINGIESGSNMVTKVQLSNPLEILTAGAAGN